MTGHEADPATLFRLYVDYNRHAEATNLLLEYLESFASLVIYLFSPNMHESFCTVLNLKDGLFPVISRGQQMSLIGKGCQQFGSLTQQLSDYGASLKSCRAQDTWLINVINSRDYYMELY